MLDILRNKVINYERLEVLFSFYLVGYIKQLGEIGIEEKLNGANNSNELEVKLLSVFRDIAMKYPMLRVALEEIEKDRLINKLNKEVILKLVKTILDVPFNIEEWQNAVEHLVQKVSDESRLIDINPTPTSLNKLGMEVLNPTEGSFYDGTAGVNGTIIYANKYSKEKGGRIETYVQELNPRLANIGIIRAFINGIEDINMYVGDTLLKPGFKEGDRLRVFDKIMMNFPFGQSWKYDESDLIYDKYSRYVYGKPTKSSSEWLYVSHMIKSLKEQGKGVAIVTSSSLFNKGTEKIRRNIIKEDVIEAIIGLPGGLFSHTNITVNMLVINRDKRIKNKILFINAEEMATVITRTKKDLSDENIALISDIYNEMKEVDEISKLVDIDELDNYLLIPSKYASKMEIETEKFGLVKIKQEEIDEVENFKKFGEIASFYRGINTSSCTLNEDDGEYKIINLSDVQDGELNLNTITKYDVKSNSKIKSYTVEEGDIIISSKGAAIKICIIPKHQGTLLISQNFIGVRLNKGYSSRFVKEYLESPLGMYLIESKQLGSTITMLNTKDLKDIDIVILPNQIQDEIMEQYQTKEEEIKEKIKALEKEAKELQVELYKQMGIEKTIEIMEVN
jgi:type I restriction enzyme M protein